MPRNELNFMEFLQSFRRGELLREADNRMSEVLAAVQETGNAREITIKLPFKVNKAGQIECVPQVAAKKPRREIGAGIYYLSDDARLTRRDPNQAGWLDEVESRRDRAAVAATIQSSDNAAHKRKLPRRQFMTALKYPPQPRG